jgi:hypothetical protein
LAEARALVDAYAAQIGDATRFLERVRENARVIALADQI